MKPTRARWCPEIWCLRVSMPGSAPLPALQSWCTAEATRATTKAWLYVSAPGTCVCVRAGAAEPHRLGCVCMCVLAVVDRTTQLLEAATGQRIGSFSWFASQHTRALALQFSPDGRVLASSTVSGKCFLWDMGQLPKPSTAQGNDAAASAGVCTMPPLCVLEDPASGGTDSVVTQLLFSPDGRWLLAIAQRGTSMKLWNLAAVMTDAVQYAQGGCCQSTLIASWFVATVHVTRALVWLLRRFPHGDGATVHHIRCRTCPGSQWAYPACAHHLLEPGRPVLCFWKRRRDASFVGAADSAQPTPPVRRHLTTRRPPCIQCTVHLHRGAATQRRRRPCGAAVELRGRVRCEMGTAGYATELCCNGRAR